MPACQASYMSLSVRLDDAGHGTSSIIAWPPDRITGASWNQMSEWLRVLTGLETGPTCCLSGATGLTRSAGR